MLRRNLLATIGVGFLSCFSGRKSREERKPGFDKTIVFRIKQMEGEALPEFEPIRWKEQKKGDVILRVNVYESHIATGSYKVLAGPRQTDGAITMSEWGPITNSKGTT